VKSWDAIVIGAGIIGLSLAMELRKSGASVLIVDKGEPGRESSWAAGGMLADFPLEMPSELHQLASASARMYPEFVKHLEAESGLRIDLRSEGTLFFPHHGEDSSLLQSHPLPAPLPELEPAFKLPQPPALFLREGCVDPRHLTAAAIAAAHNQGVDFSCGDAAQSVEIDNGRVSGVRIGKTRFAAGIVVNCAGAWARQVQVDDHGETGVAPVSRRDGRPRPSSTEHGQIQGFPIPTRPVKGQMLCVEMPQKEFVRHVVRTPDVYLIPRSNGHMLIGATLEEAGFDKQMVPETLASLRNAAIALVPKLSEARTVEAWAGLRPGTPDKLPILGETSIPGYFVATGHFRDGILLAPITARVMGQVIAGQEPELPLAAFAVGRFQA
jgi:glycine oxidase